MLFRSDDRSEERSIRRKRGYLIFLQGCEMRCRYCHNPDTWGKTKGLLMSADELLDQAERYRGYWGKEGGITVSGGEPLLQINFVRELLHKAKQRNINTCIDTALQPFTREQPFFDTFEALMRDTDLLRGAHHSRSFSACCAIWNDRLSEQRGRKRFRKR